MLKNSSLLSLATMCKVKKSIFIKKFDTRILVPENLPYKNIIKSDCSNLLINKWESTIGIRQSIATYNNDVFTLRLESERKKEPQIPLLTITCCAWHLLVLIVSGHILMYFLVSFNHLLSK